MAMSNQARNQKGHNQKRTKRFNSIKLLKTIIFGPTMAALAVTTIYFAWWGMSKLFYILHVWITGEFAPWISNNWPIILGIWAAVGITSIIYFVCVEERKKTKQQPEKSTSTTAKKQRSNEEEFDPYMKVEELDRKYPNLSNL